MRMNNLLTSLIALFLSACTASQSVTSKIIPLVNHDGPLSTDSVFEPDCHFVKFQISNSESVISGMERLLCTEDGYIVVDRKGNKLVSFDKTGRFLKSTISLIGKSKNEYISIFDAALDDSGKRIYVYCDAPCKLMILDYNLNVIDNIDFQTFTWELSVDDHCLYALSPDLEDGSVMRLMSFDKNNLSGDGKELLSTQASIPELGTKGKSIVHSGDCFFSMPFEQKLYQIKNGEITDSFQVEFEDLWFESHSDKTGLSDFLRVNKDKHWMITSICPSDTKLLFNTNGFQTFVIDRESNICTSYRGIIDTHIPLTSSRLVPTDGLYGYAVFEMNLKSTKTVLENVSEDGKKQIDPALLRLALEHKNGDNPTICIWKLK